MVTSDTKAEVLPSGVIIEPHKAKRRQRSYYFKRITVTGGNMVWVRTEMLPSDPEGRMYYMSKGFRLDPPQGTEWAKDQPPASDDPEKAALRREVEALKAQLKAKPKRSHHKRRQKATGTEGQAEGGNSELSQDNLH